MTENLVSKTQRVEPGAFKLKPAAQYLGGISTVTLRRLIASGQIRANRTLRHIIISKGELDRFLAR
jgi:excisionase family DNA binding protein